MSVIWNIGFYGSFLTSLTEDRQRLQGGFSLASKRSNSMYGGRGYRGKSLYFPPSFALNLTLL